MPDTTAPAAPAIDYDKLGASIALALGPALAEANKPMLEQLGKLTAPAPAPAPAAAAADSGKAKPLTADDVQRIVGDGLKQFAGAQQQTQSRNDFIASKMADLPAVYRNAMPQTGDAAQLAAAEQKLRAEYQADFKTGGGKVPPVNGNPPAGGASPSAAVDRSKLTPNQKIEQGLKEDAAGGSRPGAVQPGAVRPGAV